MTVDEVLAQIAIEAEPSEYCPLNVAHKVLRRYVEEVREVERLAKIDQIPAAVDYGQRLAAAREGRDDE